MPADLTQDALSELATAIRRPKGVVPFVGAGLCVPYGLPDWRTFLTSVAKDLKKKMKVSRLIRKGEYEEAAQLLYDQAENAFSELLAERLQPKKTEAVETSMSFVPLLTSDYVLTVNFDEVLESVFRAAGRPFARRLYGPGCAVSEELADEDLPAPALIKLHGSTKDSRLRVLTATEYQKHYEPENLPAPSVLRKFASQRRLLFLGCSINKDRYLSTLRQTKLDPPSHFAIVPEPRNRSHRARRIDELVKHGIRPIWFPAGEFDQISVLLEHALSRVATPEYIQELPVADGSDLIGSPICQTFIWFQATETRKELKLKWGVDGIATARAIPPVECDGIAQHQARIESRASVSYKILGNAPEYVITFHSRFAVLITDQKSNKSILVRRANP